MHNVSMYTRKYMKLANPEIGKQADPFLGKS